MKAAATTVRFFRRMTVREKLLLLLFVLVILFLWTGSLLGRISDWNQARRQAKTDLATQEQWLARAGEFTEGLEQALARVDPSKTYSGTQLSGRIDGLLREAGLAGSADIDPVRTREGEIFNDHNIRVRLSRISIAELIRFNKLLRRETPYINIQRVRLNANRRNPEELDVRFEINSFDLKTEAI